MDQNIVFILNRVRDVLHSFGTTALIVVVAMSLVMSFIHFRK